MFCSEKEETASPELKELVCVTLDVISSCSGSIVSIALGERLTV